MQKVDMFILKALHFLEEKNFSIVDLVYYDNHGTVLDWRSCYTLKFTKSLQSVTCWVCFPSHSTYE